MMRARITQNGQSVKTGLQNGFFYAEFFRHGFSVGTFQVFVNSGNASERQDFKNDPRRRNFGSGIRLIIMLQARSGFLLFDLFSDSFKHGRLRVVFVLIVKTIRIFQPERAAFFGQTIHDHGSERDFDLFQSVHR